MEIKDSRIDDGKAFDWGRTSKDYAKYRDIYPECMFKKLADLGIGIKGQRVLDLGTGTGVIPRGMNQYGAQWIGTDISENQIKYARELSAGTQIEYRVCSAEELDFEPHSFDVITAAQCFWYFDSSIIVPKIKQLLKKDGIFLKIYMSYMKEEQITTDSNSLVKKINGNWSGGNPGIKDLTTHYFENPQMDSMIVDLPFTRETWHGRMLSSRGVMAAMNQDQINQFDSEHKKMLQEKYPETFTVKHKIFLTWYKIN